METSNFELGISNLLLAMMRQQVTWLGRQEVKRLPGVTMSATLIPSYLAAVDTEAITLSSALTAGEGHR